MTFLLIALIIDFKFVILLTFPNQQIYHHLTFSYHSNKNDYFMDKNKNNYVIDNIHFYLKYDFIE